MFSHRTLVGISYATDYKFVNTNCSSIPHFQHIRVQASTYVYIYFSIYIFTVTTHKFINS